MSIFSNLNKQYDVPAEPHKMRWWHYLFLAFLIVGTIYIMHDEKQKKQEYLKCEGTIFGTVYHITYQGSTPLQDSIENVLKKVDESLSPFNKNSIITSVNNNTNFHVDHQFKEVFMIAQTVNKATNGAFDITVAPLVNAWGFGFKNKEKITPELIDSILLHVGQNKVSLNGDVVEKSDSSTMLDCSAIAKGYGVDAVGRWLESKGIVNYMVEIGGEVRVRGANPSGTNWNIGINKPIEDSTSVRSEIEKIVSISDISMATSGNYRNFYQEGEKKYAHTINPITGYPAQKDILSATVFSKDCVLADAYATSFMVLGLDSTRTILDSHPELMAFIIYTNEKNENAIWYSEQLEKFIK